MSILKRMVPAVVLKPVKVSGTYETAISYVADRTILVSFSLATGTTTNSNTIIYTSSTHTALTKDRNITTDNRIRSGGKDYKITYVNNDSPRYSVLYLSLVE